MCMIICFVLITKQLYCVDNVRRTYILINWLGLERVKGMFDTNFFPVQNKILKILNLS